VFANSCPALWRTALANEACLCGCELLGTGGLALAKMTYPLRNRRIITGSLKIFLNIFKNTKIIGFVK